MSAPREDDREAVDRAFAELVAGFHLTSDRPDPLPPADPESEPPAEPARPDWAENHPLFVFEPRPAPEPEAPAVPRGEDRYVPEALPPLPRPPLPVLLGWVGIACAALVVLLAAFGVPLPSWAGWLALLGFVGGFAVLVLRLPRSRPPDAGDGAVL